MQTKRNIGIDLLKIVSMLMIVTLHMLGHGGVLDNMPPMSRCYQVAWLIEIACYGVYSVTWNDFKRRVDLFIFSCYIRKELVCYSLFWNDVSDTDDTVGDGLY